MIDREYAREFRAFKTETEDKFTRLTTDLKVLVSGLKTVESGLKELEASLKDQMDALKKTAPKNPKDA